jgi:hypothetical protein
MTQMGPMIIQLMNLMEKKYFGGHVQLAIQIIRTAMCVRFLYPLNRTSKSLEIKSHHRGTQFASGVLRSCQSVIVLRKYAPIAKDDLVNALSIPNPMLVVVTTLLLQNFKVTHLNKLKLTHYRL